MVSEFANFYGKNINNLVSLWKVLKIFKLGKTKKCFNGSCTNKQENLAVDLLKKLKMIDYFEFIAGSDTFEFNKPDPRHLTNVVEIIKGDIKKTIMVGDSEVDAQSAENAKVPFILVEDGYTEKNKDEIKHNESIKNFVNFERIIQQCYD